MSDKFKLAVILGFFGLLAVGLTGITIIGVFRPDATATMLNAAIVLLGLASPFAVTFYMLNKQAAKLEQVEKQTNGNLTREKEENAKLRAEIERLKRRKTSV